MFNNTNNNNNSNSFLPKLSIIIPQGISNNSNINEPSAKRYKKSPVRDVNIHDKIVELALFTLNLTKEDYMNMKAEDFSNVYTINTYDKILAIEILEYYKRNNN